MLKSRINRFLNKIEESRKVIKVPELPGILISDWLPLDLNDFAHDQRDMMLIALHSSQMSFTTSEHSSKVLEFVDELVELSKSGKYIKWSGDGDLYMVKMPNDTRALITINTPINLVIIPR